MKRLAIIFLTLFLTLSFLPAQNNESEREKNLKEIAENIPFPSAYFNLTIGYNADMLNIYKLPEEKKYKKMSLSELEQLYKEASSETALLLELNNRYLKENNTEKAYACLMKAYELAMSKHKAAPANLEATQTLSDILEFIDRKDDVLALWQSFVKINQNSAYAWAQLGLYQMMQSNDSVNAIKSLEKALEVDANEPFIYVAAMSFFISKINQKSAEGLTSASEDFDISFYKNAALKYPKSELAKYSNDVMGCINIFYKMLMLVSDKISKGEPYKLIEGQEKEWKRMNKIFTAYEKSKIHKNKYMTYKCRLLLNVINADIESAKATLKVAESFGMADYELDRMMTLLYSKEKNFKLAAEHMKNSFRYKSSPEDYFTLAHLYYEDDNFLESFSILNDLFNQFPNYYDIIFAIVSIKMAEQNIDGASKLLGEMKQYFTAETKIEEHVYHIFQSAICVLHKDPQNETARANLQKIADSEHAWAKNAKTLLALFK